MDSFEHRARRSALVAQSALLAASICACRSHEVTPTTTSAPRAVEPAEVPAADGLLVCVVDQATQDPVAGAEVIALETDPAYSSLEQAMLSDVFEDTENFGKLWHCDRDGRVRVPSDAAEHVIVARCGSWWGASLGYTHYGSVTVGIAPEQSLRLVCIDEDGRPALGAIAFLDVLMPPDDSPNEHPKDTELQLFDKSSWMQRVSVDDGCVRVPHAQFWRRLVKDGYGIRIGAGVLWSDSSDDSTQAFPLESNDDLRFVVPRTGSVACVVRTAEGLPMTGRAQMLLRLLDAPEEPDDPDDRPEFPVEVDIGSAKPAIVPGILLGHRFELVWEGIPGWVDPRVEFEGPKQRGEQVSVELVLAQRAAVVSGRLIDESGKPLANHDFEAWIERDGKKVAPDQDDFVADDDGRFALDFAPQANGPAGVLVIEVATGTTSLENGIHTSVIVTLDGTDAPLARARREIAEALTAGEHDLGDVKCGAP